MRRIARVTSLAFALVGAGACSFDEDGLGDESAPMLGSDEASGTDDTGSGASAGATSTSSGSTSTSTTTSTTTTTSTSTSTSTDGGVACGLHPGGVGDCPPVCTSCEEGVCLIDCPDDTDDCAGKVVQCPMGWPCQIECVGIRTCENAVLACADAPCGLECGGVDSCLGATLMCGLDVCAAACETLSGQPVVECGESCECVPCTGT